MGVDAIQLLLDAALRLVVDALRVAGAAAHRPDQIAELQHRRRVRLGSRALGERLRGIAEHGADLPELRLVRGACEALGWAGALQPHLAWRLGERLRQVALEARDLDA